MALRLLGVLLLFVAGDFYFFQSVKTTTPNPLIHSIYWLIDLLLLGGLLAIAFSGQQSKLNHNHLGLMMASVLLIFVPKLMATPLLLAEDISRLFRSLPSRSVLISEIALAIAGSFFLFIMFGLTRGRYFYRIRCETLYFKDLPEAFDGFTITHLSDMHSGSFHSVSNVRRGLDLVNAQRSDVILFTGDLVNNQAAEMERWIPYFAQLEATSGKYAVLGNHDYGDYIRWESPSAKKANLERLKQIHAEIGFRLLLDEAVSLKKGGETISLIGVENWGKGGFHQYGNLQKATAGLPDDTFKILMSHDPSHWEAVVLHHRQHIHLTLSGHTHGMQFGIELFGIKWSPIQYMYRQWAGLYHRDNQYLYVNRGFGFLGLKGRIGIWPEIAVITLKREK